MDKKEHKRLAELSKNAFGDAKAYKRLLKKGFYLSPPKRGGIGRKQTFVPEQLEAMMLEIISKREQAGEKKDEKQL